MYERHRENEALKEAEGNPFVYLNSWNFEFLLMLILVKRLVAMLICRKGGVIVGVLLRK